ncbi:MAG: winged helix-turn-helix transcriptional regulator, partial [Deltaproteobacteria bacterium]|nr:winged helix-turn-helix transcriptional regulator [Deltaproteobacteria bacterium]
SRIEEYLFPEAALREALLNSIAHKDYSSANPIQISVYSDKIIFWNEGRLPENWTISQLKEKHPSIPFNPVIANVFFRAGLIEAWGRGIFKIIHACRVSNSPEPVFKCDFSGFFVELFAQKIKTPSEKLGEKLGERLGENRLGIIKLMQDNQQISIAELSRLIGISTTAIERNIKYLKEKEIIKRVGAAKGGHWEVIIKK